MSFLVPHCICRAFSHTVAIRKSGWQRRPVEGVVKIFPMRARKVPGMIPVVVLHNYGMLVGCEKAPIWHGVCTRIKRRSGQQKEEP